VCASECLCCVGRGYIHKVAQWRDASAKVQFITVAILKPFRRLVQPIWRMILHKPPPMNVALRRFTNSRILILYFYHEISLACSYCLKIILIAPLSVGQQSIVMGKCLCLSVCPRAYLWKFELHVQSSPNFWCALLMALAGISPLLVTLRYVF